MSTHTGGEWFVRVARSRDCALEVISPCPTRKGRKGEDYPVALIPASPDSRSDVKNAYLLATSPELLAFAEWAIRQFQGESGTGETHWEQFAEYRAGLRAIEKARGVV